MLEMPTGSGKIVSFFSVYFAYKIKFPNKIGKMVFCTRTISQL